MCEFQNKIVGFLIFFSGLSNRVLSELSALLNGQQQKWTTQIFFFHIGKEIIEYALKYFLSLLENLWQQFSAFADGSRYKCYKFLEGIDKGRVVKKSFMKM